MKDEKVKLSKHESTSKPKELIPLRAIPPTARSAQGKKQSGLEKLAAVEGWRLDYIRNYIDLKKLSLEKQEILQAKLPLTDQFKSLFISPMILIPFIENAFKHGLNTEGQNSIEIFLGIEKKILTLKVKNSFSYLKEQSDKETPGIGLENVKRRLLLVYPGRHSIAITSDNAFFNVDLKIEL